MKYEFTKASRKDGETVVTTRLGNRALKQGAVVYLYIKARWSRNTYEVKFTCNRKDGSTLKTTEWPKRFAKPSVGSPVEYDVVDFFVYHQP
jgi:hypothetical protein